MSDTGSVHDEHFAATQVRPVICGDTCPGEAAGGIAQACSVSASIDPGWGYSYQSLIDDSDQVIAFAQKCMVVPLDTTIALLAADLHRERRLATADAIVYATARRMGADLLTCAAQFEGLPDVALFPKSTRGGGPASRSMTKGTARRVP